MNGTDLQWRQELHDKLFHQDIYVLDKQRKLTHLVLHLAKYNGKLFQFPVAVGEPITPDQARKVNALCVDALIVLMSAANALNFIIFGVSAGDDIHSDVAYDIPTIIKSTGTLCKGLEALDHMEQQDIREMFHTQVVKLANQWGALFAASYLQIQGSAPGFENAVHYRWEQVEAKNIHYKSIIAKHPELRPGFRF